MSSIRRCVMLALSGLRSLGRSCAALSSVSPAVPHEAGGLYTAAQIFRFTHIVYTYLCSTWTYGLRLGRVLSNSLPPIQPRWVPSWSSRSVLLPVATFSMYASLSPKHTQFPFSRYLDTTARGLLHLGSLGTQCCCSAHPSS